MKILVLCTGNSARSILLECLLRDRSGGRIEAFSAGAEPQGAVNPFALRLLNITGAETLSLRSKSWDEFGGPKAAQMDVVITVCDSAANTPCPVRPGAPISAHWGLSDPAAIQGSEDEIKAGFQTAYDILANRTDALLALDFESMSRETLAHTLAKIGEIE